MLDGGRGTQARRKAALDKQHSLAALFNQNWTTANNTSGDEQKSSESTPFAFGFGTNSTSDAGEGGNQSSASADACQFSFNFPFAEGGPDEDPKNGSATPAGTDDDAGGFKFNFGL